MKRALAAIVVVGTLAARSARSDEAADLALLIARVAPAVVEVKAVLRTEVSFGQGADDQESELVTRGVVVDPSGLILVWNSQLSSQRLSEVMSGWGGGDMRLRITPTDFRIGVGGEAPERRAFLAASDSERDLAFLQIEGPLDGPLPAIDFARSRAPRVGETVAQISRLSAGFGRAPYVRSGRIAGEVTKPRAAWVLDGGPFAPGLPVMSLAGEPLGAVITVLTRHGESARGGDLVEMLGLRAGGVESGPLGLFLLPGEKVAELVALARRQAGDLLRERREAPTGSAGSERP